MILLRAGEQKIINCVIRRDDGTPVDLSQVNAVALAFAEYRGTDYKIVWSWDFRYNQKMEGTHRNLTIINQVNGIVQIALLYDDTVTYFENQLFSVSVKVFDSDNQYIEKVYDNLFKVVLSNLADLELE